MNLLRLLDSIYEYATGTRLALGIVILVGFAVGSVAFLAPLVVVALAISALGLDHEPNKWLGTVLILAGFVSAIVATVLSLRWVYRRSRPLAGPRSPRRRASRRPGRALADRGVPSGVPPHQPVPASADRRPPGAGAPG